MLVLLGLIAFKSIFSSAGYIPPFLTEDASTRLETRPNAKLIQKAEAITDNYGNVLQFNQNKLTMTTAQYNIMYGSTESIYNATKASANGYHTIANLSGNNYLVSNLPTDTRSLPYFYLDFYLFDYDNNAYYWLMSYDVDLSTNLVKPRYDNTIRFYLAYATNIYYSGNYATLLYTSGTSQNGLIISSNILNAYKGFIWCSDNATTAYNNGYESGRANGYEEGYSTALPIGESIGREQGYNDGYEEGINVASKGEPSVNWLKSLFITISDLGNIEILPNIKLSYVVLIPLMFMVVGFIIRWFK